MNIRYFRLLLIVRAKREDSLRNRVEAVQMACQRIGFSFTTLPSNARHVLLRWRALLSGILNGGGGSGDDVAPRTHFFLRRGGGEPSYSCARLFYPTGKNIQIQSGLFSSKRLDVIRRGSYAAQIAVSVPVKT